MIFFIGTGFSEAVLEERSVTLGKHVIAEPRVRLELYFSESHFLSDCDLSPH